MSFGCWLGSDEPLLKKLSCDRIVLGVIGTRNRIRFSYDDFELHVLSPIVEAWGLPDEIVIPAEGDSSQAIQSWADLKNIPVRIMASDWAKHGRKAGILRDSFIQREATHLLLLQGPRSNALTTMARRLDRKGRPVVISERPGLPVSAPEKLATK